MTYLSTNNVRFSERASERAAMTDINAFITDKVTNNDVFLFMKGSPDFPQCGFSGQVVQILNYLGVEYGSANVLESAELRDGIKAFTNWPTIPQLYVKGEFVGGADIVREMFQAGELHSHFEQAGIPVKQTA
jgi:monothiol glutaredoxin